MFFEAYKSILYSDTLLPDIFISEYLPSMDGDCIKVYIYCLFLSKYNKPASTQELAKGLCLDAEKVSGYLSYLENIGAISRKQDKVIINDLKEKEIKKIYRMKTTSSPEDAALSVERNKKRNEIVTAINNTFFQGIMAPSWYTDIDTWFDRYKFDEDVMYMLFQHCKSHNGLNKNYIIKVADSWHSKNIRNQHDLDSYSIEYEKFKDIKGRIIKKLKLSRNLTEYEEEYVEKWVMEYKYGFEIIELALKKTTSKINPNFNYIHSIISDWSRNGLRTKESIAAYETAKKQGASKHTAKDQLAPQYANYEQRKYDEEYYNSFFDNVKKASQ